MTAVPSSGAPCFRNPETGGAPAFIWFCDECRKREPEVTASREDADLCVGCVEHFLATLPGYWPPARSRDAADGHVRSERVRNPEWSV